MSSYQSLQNVVKIVEELRNCSSTNGKIYILEKNKNNELLKKILWYTYNDYQYGIKKTTIDKMKFNNPKHNEELIEILFTTYGREEEIENIKKKNNITVDGNRWNNNLWNMFDYLANENINNKLIKEVENLIEYFPNEEVRYLIQMILLKDLRCNINVKLINKAFKGLINTHDIMLGSKWDGKLTRKKALSLKLDGVRCSFLVSNNNIVPKTRQNKTIEGMNELNNAIRSICGDNEYFIDGELLAINDNSMDSKELFKKTSSIINSKGIKKGLTFVIFDMIPLEDYYNKKSTIKFIDRRKSIERQFENKHELIKIAPLYFITDDINKVNDKLQEVVSMGLEGLMLNDIDAPYEFKRSKTLMKVKAMSTCDIRCLRIEKGDGKYSDTLGKIVCDYKGFELAVGSGFSDEQRNFYYNNPNEILNKIVEVQYFEETKNDKGGMSLRFPIFLQVRTDKNDESYD